MRVFLLDKDSGICNVYLLIFPDGKRYLGYSTGDPEKRWQNGNNYRHNLEFTQAVEAAGGWQNIQKILLIKDVSPAVALFYEPYFIRFFDTMPPHGYNKNTGGKSGFTWCQEVKNKISAALSKAVDQIDPETGAVLATWPSMSEASRATGINDTAIWRAAHGQPNKAAVYDWQLVE